VKLTIDDLHDYVLDLLPNAERRKIDAEVARSPELAAEVRAAREALAKSVAIAGLVKPSEGARSRLLGALSTGFVRLPRGLEFPYHRHVGHEINYVMEGAVRDGDGSLYLPGEAIVMTPGTEHEFSIAGDKDALIAVVQAGFEFVPKPG
jgi:quercetin dioxygenase-like cupin family protein